VINLADQSFAHAVTGNYPIDNNINNSDLFAYTITNWYTLNEFYGIMIDTGASKKSTAGYGQYLAYKKVNNITINTTKAGTINVQFGISSIPSIGSITIDIPIGRIEFHIIEANTLFLLCLADMDSLGVFYNNLMNILVTLTRSI
jgi:hypothetical protein